MIRAAWIAFAGGFVVGGLPHSAVLADSPSPTREEALAAMKTAGEFYRTRVAYRGGYVYYYSLDLTRRWGEGVASDTQIWVQPPGTPTVGDAWLAAWKATGDSFYLEAARETAHALIFGQLRSGGWTHAIDFDPKGSRSGDYRNGKGRGRNNSTLDDDTTQSALRFLMRYDQAAKFQDRAASEAVRAGLDALLAAQFPNGGFPQVWTGPVSKQPIVKASFPDYDWRTENRIKNYWDLYTLNDGLAGDVVDMLAEAHAIYGDQRCLAAILKLGDFLILAQLPDPQPAWAQQYTYEMRPAWARRFEPPAVTGGESQDAIDALLKIHRLTNDPKYLGPIPRAVAYLQKSQLPDGRLARFYELETNRPLYLSRKYELTYDDGDLPTHYGFQVGSKLDALQKQYEAAAAGKRPGTSGRSRTSASRAREVMAALDSEGRWVSSGDQGPLVGQPGFKKDDRFLSSAVFSRNLTTLSGYVARED